MKVYYEKEGVIVRDSMQSDITYLKDNLKLEDMREVWSSHHKSPEEALQESFNDSLECLSVVKDGLPLAMFGIVPVGGDPNRAVMWLLSSEGLFQVSREFLRYSASFVKLMFELHPEFDLLYNYVDARNLTSINWLKWIGAKLEGPLPYGVEQKPFHFFSFTKNVKALRTVTARQDILSLEEKMMQHPEAMIGDCFPLKHTFAKGTYVREIEIPKGMVVVSKIHKFSHPVFVLKGDISIYTEDGIKRIKAPASFISPAGAKRVGVTHEDTVWVTVHATEHTDLEKIEEELIAKNFQEFDEQAIKNFVVEALSQEATCLSSLSR